MRRVFIFGIFAIIGVACNNGSTKVNDTLESSNRGAEGMVTGRQRAADTPVFSNIHFASEADTSCGMPLSARITDTMSYAGKIYGFCSPGCKQEFAALVTDVSGAGQVYQGHH